MKIATTEKLTLLPFTSRVRSPLITGVSGFVFTIFFKWEEANAVAPRAHHAQIR